MYRFGSWGSFREKGNEGCGILKYKLICCLIPWGNQVIIEK